MEQSSQFLSSLNHISQFNFSFSSQSCSSSLSFRIPQHHVLRQAAQCDRSEASASLISIARLRKLGRGRNIQQKYSSIRPAFGDRSNAFLLNRRFVVEFSPNFLHRLYQTFSIGSQLMMHMHTHLQPAYETQGRLLGSEPSKLQKLQSRNVNLQMYINFCLQLYQKLLSPPPLFFWLYY